MRNLQKDRRLLVAAADEAVPLIGLKRPVIIPVKKPNVGSIAGQIDPNDGAAPLLSEIRVVVLRLR